MWKFSTNGMVLGLKADVEDVGEVVELKTKSKLVGEVEIEAVQAFVAKLEMKL